MYFFVNLVYIIFLCIFVSAKYPDCPVLKHEIKFDLCEIRRCDSEYLCCPLDDLKAACLPKNRTFSSCVLDKNVVETQVFENCFKSGCPKTKICCPKLTGGSNCQDFFDK